MRIVLVWLLWLIGMGLAFPVQRSPAEELEGFLTSVQTLTASFEQEVIDEAGQVSQRSQGRFYLKRPGLFRWNYETPFKQEIVSDGKKVWFFDPDLEQVTVKPVDQALGSAPALLLSGELKLNERFRIRSQGRSGDVAWLELEPKSSEDMFRSLRVEMVNGRLRSMEMADNFGQLSRVKFRQLRINVSLSPKLFKFSPPPGIDVFEG